MTTAVASIDLAVEWRGEQLVGTLHLPAGPGPHALVVMLQGSGPADRDAEGYFVLIRQAFLDRGVATYAFDKPGCGASTGDWRRYGILDRGDQAIAVIGALRERDDIDAARTGIWGQSQGGWMVQLIAGEVPDLAFAIANSGPTIGVREQNAFGCEWTMRSQGYSESDIAEALAFIERLHEAAESGAGWDVVESELIAPVSDEGWASAYFAIGDADDWRGVEIFATEGYDPLEALARVSCPFLAVYGANDVLLPAWRSAEESGEALGAAGNTDATVVVFAGADHRIRDAEGEFVPGYLDLIGDWAAARV